MKTLGYFQSSLRDGEGEILVAMGTAARATTLSRALGLRRRYSIWGWPGRLRFAVKVGQIAREIVALRASKKEAFRGKKDRSLSALTLGGGFDRRVGDPQMGPGGTLADRRPRLATLRPDHRANSELLQPFQGCRN